MYKELNTIITIIAPFLLVFSSYDPVTKTVSLTKL